MCIVCSLHWRINVFIIANANSNCWQQNNDQNCHEYLTLLADGRCFRKYHCTNILANPTHKRFVNSWLDPTQRMGGPDPWPPQRTSRRQNFCGGGCRRKVASRERTSLPLVRGPLRRESPRRCTPSPATTGYCVKHTSFSSSLSSCLSPLATCDS